MGTELGSEVEITELEKIEADRVDGVGTPANGIPFLLMKSLPDAAKAGGEVTGPTHGAFTGTHSHSHDAGGFQGEDGNHLHKHSHDGDGDHSHSHAGVSVKAKAGDCSTCKGTGKIMDGKRDCPDCDGRTAEKSAVAIAAKAVTDGQIDQDPDIDLGHQIMHLLAQAIEGEAQEIGAGSYGETCDVDLLNGAAHMIGVWLGHEQSPGPDDDMGMLMCSAAVKAKMTAASQNDLPDSAFAYIEPGGEKDEDGKTTPRSKRHFPVHDAAHARNALARLSSSPFGDKAKGKVHAAAKKFGIDVSDTSKSAVAGGEAPVDTEAQGTGGLAKAVEDAVTKAVGPLQERITALGEDLAKVKAAPVPGGPVMSVTRAQRSGDGTDYAAKAAYFEQMAVTVASPSDAEGYRQLAAQARAKIGAPAQ